MSYSELEKRGIENIVGTFCKNVYPESVQDKVKIDYYIKGQSIFIFESRPLWNKSSEWQDLDFAKITYIKSRDIWKLYWRRANDKWVIYRPHSESRTLDDLIKTIKEDKFGCFLG